MKSILNVEIQKTKNGIKVRYKSDFFKEYFKAHKCDIRDDYYRDLKYNFNLDELDRSDDLLRKSYKDDEFIPNLFHLRNIHINKGITHTFDEVLTDNQIELYKKLVSKRVTKIWIDYQKEKNNALRNFRFMQSIYHK